MHLNQIAYAILFGTRLEEKLSFDENFTDGGSETSPFSVVPRFPGRPDRLARIGKAAFPKLAELTQDTSRGRLLHFFANHELLAMELMALMLLKFPEAPLMFRAGIARTILEEQNHLQLYVERMRELGVDFGEMPVSDYFWNAMKSMSSPLDFVTQMSLTLEQANLDYSLFYQHAVARVGDEKTAAILERVYREEIGHVKHGLTWFNRWKNPSEDDWDAYLRLLPPPMTPRRAKGLQFSAESRRAVGFSERFIHELEVHGGSKGRPPVFWVFNPLCDFESARGKTGFTGSEAVRRMGMDLECLPMYLALESDVVLVQELPRTDWLKPIRELGFLIPEFRDLSKASESPRETKIGGLEPWGWSPEPFERFKPWRNRLIENASANGRWSKQILDCEDFSKTGIALLFSKSWSSDFLREWLESHPDDQAIFCGPEVVGRTYTDWDQARARLIQSFSDQVSFIAKAPWGTSGTQNKRILHVSEMDSSLGGWIRNTINLQGSIVLEPWLNKVVDLSMQIEVRENEVRTLGIRPFVNGARLEYRGTHLDPKLSTLSPEVLRFLHTDPSPLERWRKFAGELGRRLRENGYLGPAGIDALVWADATGRLFLKPLVELNPRWTMGRVALELEAHVLPGVRAAWMFIPIRELQARGLAANPSLAAGELAECHPIKIKSTSGGPRLIEGVVFTSDPERAREVLTVLVVGPRAIADQALIL